MVQSGQNSAVEATGKPKYMLPTVTGENLTWIGNLESGDVIKLDSGWKVSDLVGTSPAVQRAYWHCDEGYGIDHSPQDDVTNAPEIRGHFFKVVNASDDRHPEFPEGSVVAVQCDENGIEVDSPLTICFNNFGNNSENTAESVPVLGRVIPNGPFQAFQAS